MIIGLESSLGYKPIKVCSRPGPSANLFLVNQIYRQPEMLADLIDSTNKSTLDLICFPDPPFGFHILG